MIRVWAVTMEIRDSPLLRYRWPMPHLLAYTWLLFLLLFSFICSHQMKTVPACQGLMLLRRMESEKQVPAAHLSHTALSIYFSYSRLILGRPGFIYLLPMDIRKSMFLWKDFWKIIGLTNLHDLHGLASNWCLNGLRYGNFKTAVTLKPSLNHFS